MSRRNNRDRVSRANRDRYGANLNNVYGPQNRVEAAPEPAPIAATVENLATFMDGVVEDNLMRARLADLEQAYQSASAGISASTISMEELSSALLRTRARLRDAPPLTATERLETLRMVRIPYTYQGATTGRFSSGGFLEHTEPAISGSYNNNVNSQVAADICYRMNHVLDTHQEALFSSFPDDSYSIIQPRNYASTRERVHYLSVYDDIGRLLPQHIQEAIANGAGAREYGKLVSAHQWRAVGSLALLNELVLGNPEWHGTDPGSCLYYSTSPHLLMPSVAFCVVTAVLFKTSVPWTGTTLGMHDLFPSLHNLAPEFRNIMRPRFGALCTTDALRLYAAKPNLLDFLVDFFAAYSGILYGGDTLSRSIDSRGAAMAMREELVALMTREGLFPSIPRQDAISRRRTVFGKPVSAASVQGKIVVAPATELQSSSKPEQGAGLRRKLRGG